MKKIILLLVLVSLSCSGPLEPEPKLDPKLTINIYGGNDYESKSKVFVNGEENICVFGEGDPAQIIVKKFDSETGVSIRIETSPEHEFFGFSGGVNSKEKEISFVVSDATVLNIDLGLNTDLVKEVIPVGGVYEIKNAAELRWYAEYS